MKTLKIKASLRQTTGKKDSKELRKQGMIPCVMYGGGDVLHFVAHENEFRHLVYTNHVYLVLISIDGKEYNAILKDIQFHPVSDKVNHMDFIQVLEDKPAIVNLPVSLIGNSEGIKAGGKLRLRRRYLRVKGLLNDLPETLDVDITNINIGQVIKVAQLKYDKLELLDPSQSMVVGVTASRVSKGMEPGEAETGDVAETVAEEAAKEKSEEEEK